MPLVGDDGLPDQPEMLPGIDEQARIGIGKAGRVRQKKGFTPGLGALLLSRAEHFHIVGVALSRAVVPANQ